MLREILLAGGESGDALAAALLRAVRVGADALDVPKCVSVTTISSSCISSSMSISSSAKRDLGAARVRVLLP